MSSSLFREQVVSSYDGDFFHTPYQLACQLGLYYESSENYFPRFYHNPNIVEVLTYLKNWLIKYPAPNPYTRQGFQDLKPESIHSELSKLLLQNTNGLSWLDAKSYLFKEVIGNDDILTNTINSYSDIIHIKNNQVSLKDGATASDLSTFILSTNLTDRNDKKGFFDLFNVNDYYSGSLKPSHKSTIRTENKTSELKIFTSIKTKPFIILAGLSGTGKSRLVRTLAYQFNNITSDRETKNKTPTNFQLIKVKPNWHDSSDLLGYESRISGKDRFVTTEFIHFIVKAWQHPETPFYLCLDEMNLAPVEQYFAEFLSALETRRMNNGTIKTDALVSGKLIRKYGNKEDGVDPDYDLWSELGLNNFPIQEELKANGLCLPSNLIVMGTVNMDETTHSFSRKVLDRAMTIEMNDINLAEGLSPEKDDWNYPTTPLQVSLVISEKTQGTEVYEELGQDGENIIKYLELLNTILEGTPFKIAYRVRDEFLLYAYNFSLLENKENDWINSVLDEMTLMKILPRIEGDEDKTKILDDLILFFEKSNLSKSLFKATEMAHRRRNLHYTSFWI